MPFINVPDGTELFYDVIGKGPAIIATHGFSESGRYWTSSSVASRLSAHFKLITLDTRGHGRSRDGATLNDSIDTLVADIFRLVDHLELDQYYFLGHATGSVILTRAAMQQPPGLRGISVTSAASATAMISTEVEPNRRFFEGLADFYANNTWQDIEPVLKARPKPFLHAMNDHPEREVLWSRILTIFKENQPARLSKFAQAFYRDPDPHIEGLRDIRVPTQVVIAEHDYLMIEPSETIAANVPNAETVFLSDVGHMTAYEAPQRLGDCLIDFFIKQEASA